MKIKERQLVLLMKCRKKVIKAKEIIIMKFSSLPFSSFLGHQQFKRKIVVTWGLYNFILFYVFLLDILSWAFQVISFSVKWKRYIYISTKKYPRLSCFHVHNFFFITFVWGEIASKNSTLYIHILLINQRNLFIIYISIYISISIFSRTSNNVS